MKALSMAALTAILLLGPTSFASAQYYVVRSPRPVFYAPPPVVSPAVSYSYYPSGPVAFAPSVIVPTAPPALAPAGFVAPAANFVVPQASVSYAPPVVSYAPPVVAPSYGVYSQTTTYGILRPRVVTNQYYYIR
jgi:hypothetical protein